MKKMKKPTSILLAILMCLSISAAAIAIVPATAMALKDATDADASTIRVKLSTGNSATEVDFTIQGVYSVAERQDLGPLAPGTYKVRMEGSKLSLYNPAGKAIYSGAAAITVKRSNNPAGDAANLITLKAENTTRTYRGNMKFWADYYLDGAGGKHYYVETVNHIFLETYLYGVVAFEMSNSFPLEALKAQAVAARGYAAKTMEGSRGGNYDIGDTSSDQVYKGFNATYTSVISAVDGTRGKVMRYPDANGAIITTYFAASNGGQTDRTENVWSSALPYFQIQDDPYDLANPSSVERAADFPAGTLTDKETDPNVKYAEDTMDPKLVAFIKYNIERNLIPTLNTDTKKYLATDDDIFVKAVTGLEPQLWPSDVPNPVKPYCVNDKGVAANTLPDPSQAHSPTNCPSKDYTWANLSLMVKLTVQDPATQEVTGTEDVDYTFHFDIRNSLKNDTVNEQWCVFDPGNGLRIFAVEKDLDANNMVTNYKLVNRRYGHGIGMSQRGAQQRAKSDDTAVNTYDKILAFYYPGTTLADLPLNEAGLTDPPAVPTPTPTATPAPTQTVAPEQAPASPIALGEIYNVSKTYMYQGKSTSSAKVATFKRYERYWVVQRDATWVKGRYGTTNRDGYFLTKYSRFYSLDAKVASSKRKLMSAASSRANTILTLPKGAKVRVLTYGTWCKVSYNGKQGFVSKSYLTFTRIK